MEMLIRQVLQREHLSQLKTPFENGFREKEKRMREKEEEMKKEMGLKWERERDVGWGGREGEEESDEDDYFYGDEDEDDYYGEEGEGEGEKEGERKILAPGEIKISNSEVMELTRLFMEAHLVDPPIVSRRPSLLLLWLLFVVCWVLVVLFWYSYFYWF